MTETARSSAVTKLIERVLRIPPAPSPPAGAPGSLQTFRAAKGFYHYRLIQWGIKQVGAVIGLCIGFSIVARLPDFPYKFLLDAAELLGVVSFLAYAPFSFLMVHIDYQLRWYIITDRSLRIREGLVQIGEKTISFANIQNISIQQGPVQRLFGIADVQVRTAGGGTSPPGHPESPEHNMHLGYFRGVENAPAIRDAILERVRRLRDAGLGDPDPDHAGDAEHDPDVLAAARDLLAAARELRARPGLGTLPT